MRSRSLAGGATSVGKDREATIRGPPRHKDDGQCREAVEAKCHALRQWPRGTSLDFSAVSLVPTLGVLRRDGTLRAVPFFVPCIPRRTVQEGAVRS